MIWFYRIKLLIHLIRKTCSYVLHSQAADAVLAGIASDTGGYSFYFSGSQVSTGMQDALLATIERRRNKDSPITVSILSELYKLTIPNPLCVSKFWEYGAYHSPSHSRNNSGQKGQILSFHSWKNIFVYTWLSILCNWKFDKCWILGEWSLV